MVVILISLLFIAVMLNYGTGLTCYLNTTGGCAQGEQCIFSTYKDNDTHVGNCSTYTNRTCCSDTYLTGARVKSGTCGMGENGTISMFDWTDAHAENYNITGGNYISNYTSCVAAPWFCTLRSGTSCSVGEECVISMNSSTDSHVGKCGYYNFQLCCRVENQPPKWSDQGQNASMIDIGDAVKLSAYWTDNGNISYAVLSTNETGGWQNKSGSYGSAMQINTNASWSNFTWQNSSVPGGAVVWWKIYANDTAGNWNVTDEMSFTVKLIAMQISDRLTEGVFFTNRTGAETNVQYNVEINEWNNATWDYNSTSANKTTEYWIKNMGTGSEDICMKGTGDLQCVGGLCGSGVNISIDNVGWNNDTVNNATWPSYDTTKRLSTSYQKVAYGLGPDSYIYLRFWLFVPTGKPSGTYNTTYSARAVEAGTSC